MRNSFLTRIFPLLFMTCRLTALFFWLATNAYSEPTKVELYNEAEAEWKKAMAEQEQKLPGIWNLSKQLKEDYERFGPPPSNLVTRRNFTLDEAQNMARSAMPQGAQPDFNYRVKTNWLTGSVYRLLVNQFSLQENPIADIPKKGSVDKKEKQERDETYFLWRQSQLIQLESQRRKLLHELLADWISKQGVTLFFPARGLVEIKESDIDRFSIIRNGFDRIPEDFRRSFDAAEREWNSPRLSFDGVSEGVFIVLKSSKTKVPLLNALEHADCDFKDRLLRVGVIEDTRLRAKVLHEMASFFAKNNAFDEVSYTIDVLHETMRIEDVDEVIRSSVKADIGDHFFYRVSEYEPSELNDKKNTAPKKESSNRVKNEGRDFPLPKNKNPSNNSVDFWIERSDGFAATDYYKQRTSTVNPVVLVPVDLGGLRTERAVETLGTSVFFAPDKEGLIAVPHRSGVQPFSISVHSDNGFFLKQGEHFDWVQSPHGEGLFLKIKNPKQLGKGFGFVAEFINAKNPEPKGQDPVLNAKHLKKIAKELETAGLLAIAEELEGRVDLKQVVHLSTLAQIVQSASLYSYADFSKVKPRVTKSQYALYAASLNEAGELRMQCDTAGHLLHSIIQHYSELAPNEKITSRLVAGKRAFKTKTGQILLLEIGHLWVEAGHQGQALARLDPTPTLMDSKSPKQRWAPEEAAWKSFWNAQEKRESPARWWKRFQFESGESVERIQAQLEKLNQRFIRAEPFLARLRRAQHPYLQLGAVLTALEHLQARGDLEGATAIARRAFGGECPRGHAGAELVEFLSQKAKALSQIPAQNLKLREYAGAPLVNFQNYYALAKFAEVESGLLDARVKEGKTLIKRIFAPEFGCQFYFGSLK